jgi:3D (Asp-Asp-Asp) domain-containing protein
VAMIRKRQPLRTTIVCAEKPSRGRGAAFVWVSGFALAAYLGTAVAAGHRERLWGFNDGALPEDGASVFSVVTRASWYGPDFDGSPTASGEPFDMYSLTAAHRSLPLGSRVLVRNLKNNHTVVVRINDRGPYIHGRDIDLSYRAAQVLGMVRPGVVPVEITPF